ncbi:metallophosphoesterase family protein [Salinarchaeum laminariae]|uniref:metallophosphoesterase family protein n=1 Tax=Salinarchaeum laminariae TaxID=869888 RepID=UPI0020BE644D|nr:DNA repair exonuclease [Salinarchaeum laminariae]
MSVRFLQAADFHLGSQLSTIADRGSTVEDPLESALYTSVERLFDVAISEAVDFMIVAGDLYDQDSRSVTANLFLQEQFERLAEEGIPAYVAYGNHDPVGSATTYVDLPDNVNEFDHEDPEEFLYPDAGSPEARIWGQSYRDRSESRSMYRQFTPADDRIPNIGVLHTSLDPEGRLYVPVARSKLESKDAIQYWALGHVHDARIFESEQPVAYPGVPQGRDIGELGLGGGYLVELDDGGSPDIEFIPTSPVVWQTVTVDVGDEGVSSIPDLKRRLEHVIDDLSTPMDRFDGTSVSIRDPEWGVDGFVCRWTLTGNGPAHETLSQDDEAIQELTRRAREQFSSRQPFVWTEAIRDETGPPVPPIDELRDSDRVIEEFLSVSEEFDGEASRAVFRETVGEAWEPVDDHEEIRADELPLTEE